MRYTEHPQQTVSGPACLRSPLISNNFQHFLKLKSRQVKLSSTFSSAVSRNEILQERKVLWLHKGRTKCWQFWTRRDQIRSTLLWRLFLQYLPWETSSSTWRTTSSPEMISRKCKLCSPLRRKLTVSGWMFLYLNIFSWQLSLFFSLLFLETKSPSQSRPSPGPRGAVPSNSLLHLLSGRPPEALAVQTWLQDDDQAGTFSLQHSLSLSRS